MLNNILKMFIPANGALESVPEERKSIARELPAFEDHAAQKKRYTTCYMCACRCGIEVTVEDNRVRFIRGNPNHQQTAQRLPDKSQESRI